MQSIPNQPIFLNLEFIFAWLTTNIFAKIFTPEFWAFVKGLATFLLIIVIAIIMYCLVRLYEITRPVKESEVISNDDIPVEHPYNKKNPIWEGIRNKLLSDNQSEWRLAIIEADIYLDKILDSKGFYGDTIGDKLKNINENQLASINIAWEAHKVRNKIAHDGEAFVITMPESRRVLSYYEIVFRDLDVIE